MSVTVLAEHRQGTIRDVTYEMLAAGRRLAHEMDGELEAVILGDDCEAMASELTRHAPRVVCGCHPALRYFSYETYQHVLLKLIKERKPAVFMLADSALGADLGPSLAVKLDAGIVSDVVDFHWTDNELVVSRGMYGGKLNADLSVKHSPAIVMVRQSFFRPEPIKIKGELVHYEVNADLETGLQTRHLGIEELSISGIDITKADILVGVGRGVKEEKNLEPVQEFADSIGAVLVGSRPVVDAGWLPKERQVGSSGKTVKPKLYIALGISGAFQHIAGMKGADTIIAVNKDPNAPIFAVADYGIVDDLHKVVPVLRKRLQEMKS